MGQEGNPASRHVSRFYLWARLLFFFLGMLTSSGKLEQPPDGSSGSCSSGKRKLQGLLRPSCGSHIISGLSHSTDHVEKQMTLLVMQTVRSCDLGMCICIHTKRVVYWCFYCYKKPNTTWEERVYFYLWPEFMEAKIGIQAQEQELEVKTIEKHCLLVCTSRLTQPVFL